MSAKSAVDLMESSSGVHFSGFHMDGFEQREASIEQPTTSETDMYKQPFVIGVFSYGHLPVIMSLSTTYEAPTKTLHRTGGHDTNTDT